MSAATSKAMAPKAIAEDRSRVYWLLSRLFLDRPEEDFLAEIAGWLASAAAQAEVADGEASQDDPIRAALAALGEAVNDPAEDLAVEHTRLLRGIREGYGPPPPFESLHRNGQAMGAATVAVVRAMAEAGFTAVAPEAGPQDHIGAELRFMALLVFEEARAWGADDAQGARGWRARQAAFLDRHLLRWVPAYCAILEDAAADGFYRAVAVLTREALAADRRLLADLERSEGEGADGELSGRPALGEGLAAGDTP